MANEQSPPSGLAIRGGRDSDSEQLITLIESIYAEYPGCVLDVDGEAPHLRHPASAFARWNGALWVAELNGRVAGCVGFADHDEAVEVKHLYVASAARRQGLGSRLAGLVEEAARERGRLRVELWTDTRFTAAHRLYERLGYLRGPRTRKLHDLSATVEYFYSKSLWGTPTAHARQECRRSRREWPASGCQGRS